jgi:hypothetical protein
MSNAYGKTYYLVGKFASPLWSFQGLFEWKTDAEEFAKERGYFVAEVELGEALQDRERYFDVLWYPGRETREQGIKRCAEMNDIFEEAT